MDVKHLTDFVDGLENGFMLRSNLDELEQTIQLLQSDNTDEFFDISTRNKKYGRVDSLNGPILLEKYVFPIHLTKWMESTANQEHRRVTQSISATDKAARGFANFSSNISSRFGTK